jgi:hypothetical protein
VSYGGNRICGNVFGDSPWMNASDVARTPDGGLLVVGWVFDSAVLGSGPNAVTIDNPGDWNVYLARFDANCQFQWARVALSFSGGRCNGSAVKVAPDRTIYVTGWFGHDITFGGGEPNETHLTSPGHRDWFLASFDGDGHLRWVRQAGGPTVNDEITTFDLALAPDGTLYTTGRYEGNVTFGAGEPSQTTFTTDRGYGLFLTHSRPDGSLSWVRSFGGNVAGMGLPFGVAALSDSSVYVTGEFEGTIDFGGVALSSAPPPNPSADLAAHWDHSVDLFVGHFRADGTTDWARSAGGPGYDRGTSVAVDSQDHAILVGTMGYQLDTPTEAWIGRLAADGSFQILRKIANAQAYDVAAANDDSWIVAGGISAPALFGAGEPRATQVTPSDANGYIARYAADGGLGWVRPYNNPNSVIALPDGGSAVVGNTHELTVLGP